MQLHRGIIERKKKSHHTPRSQYTWGQKLHKWSKYRRSGNYSLGSKYCDPGDLMVATPKGARACHSIFWFVLLVFITAYCPIFQQYPGKRRFCRIPQRPVLFFSCDFSLSFNPSLSCRKKISLSFHIAFFYVINLSTCNSWRVLLFFVPFWACFTMVQVGVGAHMVLASLRSPPIQSLPFNLLDMHESQQTHQ